MSENHEAPNSGGPPPGSSHGSGPPSHPPSRPRSHTQRSRSAVQSRTELLHRLLEEAIANKISDEELSDRLQNLQATPEESNDVFNELAQRRQQEQGGRPQGGEPEGGGQRPGHTGGGDNDAAGTFRTRIGWELFKSKLDALRADGSGEHDALDFLASLRDDEDSGAIPQAVLDVAPYLADVASSSESDHHIAKTLEIRLALSKEKVADKVITRLQLANLADPLPKSIWRDVVADKFVHFEKVFAAIDSAFDYDDEPKDFHGGYVLVKRDQFCARKALETEGDWIRVFDAWSAAVKLVYRHRAAELDAYKRIILNVFHARRLEPFIAIRVDHDIREDYAKSPFHLDDRTHSDVPLFTHLASPYAAPTRGGKASLAARLSSPSSKRTPVVCENWNFGRCDEPCRGARRHGQCSECGAKHRAKDFSQCLGSLQGRRGRRGTFGGGAGPSSG